MSNQVDSRIVEMKFNKGDFEKGISDTIRALENLKKTLALEGATKGLDEVNNASKRFSLKNIVDNLTSIPSALGRATAGFAGFIGNVTGISAALDKVGGAVSGMTGKVSGAFSALMNPIDTFRSRIRLDGATQGLAEVQSQTNKMNFAPLNSAVAGVSGQFSAMTVVATTALATVAHKVTETVGMITKALTVQPVMSGFSEYELKLGAIQTIMAGSGASLDVVNSKLAELNEYSDKTIYSFGDMTQSIGKFTNAGVSLDASIASIKGVANVAAISGANSNEASRAMYNFAQALSAGYVKLLDWKSIELANMGTKEFKQQLIDAAVAQGTLTKKGEEYVTSAGNSVTATKGFNESLADAWLSSEVLTKTLGDYSDASTDIGKRATAAASDVKTLSQMFDTLKETAQSGWAETWEVVFGDFNEAKTLFTNVNNVVGGMISGWADARNELLRDWDSLGGRTALIDGIKMAWEGLMSIIKPVREAFREIFPAKTGRDLLNLTVAFREFARGLKIGEETASGLKRTFKGFFAIFSIVKQVIGAVVGAIADLFGKVGEGSGSILNFTGGIADVIVALDEWLRKSGALKEFFSGLTSLLSVPLALLAGVGKAIAALFLGWDASGASQVSDTIDSVKEKLDPLQAAVKRVGDFLARMGGMLKRVGSSIGNALGSIGDAIANAFSKVSFDKVLGVIQTGLLGAILLTIKKFFKGGDMSIDFGGGLLSQAKEALSGVSETMQNMQQNLKANILLKIAAAMMIMAGAITLLATVDSEKLKSSLIGMGIGMGIMGSTMVALVKALGTVGLAHIYIITSGMLKMALAMLALAGALKILASLSIGDTLQALVAMGGALASIALAMKLMPKGMIAQAAALLILGTALNVIAVAMKLFATMEWEQIGRGLSGMAGALVAIAAGMRLMPANMVAQAAALLILSVAINAMAVALKVMATMSWDDIAHGLVALGGALIIIAGAMHLMPGGSNMVLQAAGLLAVSVALNIMAGALRLMGGMSWEEIGKGLVTLGGAMLILAVGLNAMSGTAILGAGALLVAAAALAILTPVLITLGNLDLGTIITSLGLLAGVFLIFAVGGMALAPLVPVFLGLGAAMLIFGAGIALVGLGMVGIGVGFAAIVATAAGAIQVLAQLIGQFLSSIGAIVQAIVQFLVALVIEIAKAAPKIVSAFIDILVKFIAGVANAAPQLVQSFIKILTSILDGIIQIAPKIGQAFLAILTTLINVVIAATPKIAQLFLTLLNTALAVIIATIPKILAAGIAIITAFLGAIATAIPRIVPLALQIIVNFLNAIASKIGSVVTSAVNVIVAFINGISSNLGRVIQAGVRLIISFINGVASAIRNNSAALGAAGANLATAIIEGMARGLTGGVGVIANKAKAVAKGALDAAKSILGIASPSKEFEAIGKYVIDGFVKGLTGNSDEVKNAFDVLNDMIKNSQKTATESIKTLKEQQKELTRARLDDNIAVRDAGRALGETKKNKDADALDLEKATRNLADATAKREENIRAIEENEKAIAELSAEFLRLDSAQATLNNSFDVGKKKLIGLAEEYKTLTDQLEKANNKLAEAIKVRDDYQKSIADSYDNLPDIDDETTVDGYIQGMLDAAEKTELFTESLARLRELGLNDTLYKELLAQGTDALPFVLELLKGGEAAIETINATSDMMAESAAELGKQSAEALYQAGVDTAQGLVDGIKARQSAVVSEMEQIAEMMLRAIKEKLGIQSPSKQMRILGQFAGRGMVEGLNSYKALVGKSAEGLGSESMRALKNSLASISETAMTDVDMSPTIRPVLDLSNVKKNAGQLSSILGGQALGVDAAYSAAQNASAGYRSNQLAIAQAQETLATPQTNVTFVQNNTSPKALSQAEIYRQTNNQLSVAKGALTK